MGMAVGMIQNKRVLLAVAGLCAALALAGCGRKAVPVAPQPEGRMTPVIPDATGTARLPRATALSSSLSAPPAEITANPARAGDRRFVLDGLLN